MTRHGAILALLGALLLCGAPPGPRMAAQEPLAEAGAEAVCRAGGFRVRAPAAGWSVREIPDPHAAAVEVQVTLDARADHVRAAISVRPATPGVTAAVARDYALGLVSKDPQYADAAPATLALAGRSAPGLAVRRTVAGLPPFRIEQFYLVENGLLYGFLQYAPEAEWQTHAAACGRVWSSFALEAPDGSLAERARRLALAARCGSEVAWAPDWATAAARARAERRAILLCARFFGPFQLTDPAPAGPLMDPDVLELVRERFVPLRLAPGVKTPLADPKVYGMSPGTFGLAWLVTDAEGRVARETFDLDERSLYGWLAEAVAGHDVFAGAEAPAAVKETPLAHPARLLARGEASRARELLKMLGLPGELTSEADRAAAARLRAIACRRLRRGEEALAALAEARAAGDAGVEVDEAEILLRLGRTPDARRKLEAALAAGGGAGARSGEVRYWLGECSAQLEGTAAAEPIWARLVAERPEDRWAWRAAARLTSTAQAAGFAGPVEWPTPAQLDALLPIGHLEGRTVGRPSTEVAGIARAGALRYLLRAQRADGSWPHPSEVGRAPRAPANGFVDAVTALAADALYSVWGEPVVREAADRAVAFLLRSHRLWEAYGDRALFIDYGVWRQALVLGLFARCRREGRGDAVALEAACRELVRRLAAKRRPRGGWSYYLSPDLGPGGVGQDQSISFITAAVLLGLCAARDVGIAEAAPLARAAADCLERMRRPDGRFEYLLFHAAEGVSLSGGPGGDAGRGPVCTLALAAAGRAGEKELGAALDLFLQHAAGLERERTKALLHTGPDGQGSHYVLFDYAFAARAVRGLPEAARGKYRAPLVALWDAARTADGAFRDYPFNGAAYGAAMGLRALLDLEPRAEGAGEGAGGGAGEPGKSRDPGGSEKR
ncbi:MAG: hypothetical protein HZA54_13910 [Planctomycetes bacterium]|nr:hypothetical protein [Planctomycetota bacterium]